MRLDWALLANAAEAPPNGLVYILGAGFDTLVRESFPTPFGGVIVLRLQTTRLETERPHKVEVHCSDEDGKPVLPQPIVLNLPARQVPTEYHTDGTCRPTSSSISPPSRSTGRA